MQNNNSKMYLSYLKRIDNNQNQGQIAIRKFTNCVVKYISHAQVLKSSRVLNELKTRRLLILEKRKNRSQETQEQQAKKTV